MSVITKEVIEEAADGKVWVRHTCEDVMIEVLCSSVDAPICVFLNDSTYCWKNMVWTLGDGYVV